jgi:uncharacterized protein (TIGR03000 family)
MNMSCKICMGVTVAFVLAAASPAFAQATAEITILVPADAELFFNGAPTAQRGTERLFVTPPLEVGKKYQYDVLARWQQNGRPREQTKQVLVSAGARIRVDFLAAPADNPGEGATQAAAAAEDKEVVDSKATRRVAASSVDFRKALSLGYSSLRTLGTRIDAARRAHDPVALANTAKELAAAEAVSGKKASLTAKALARESAQLAALRRQVAELRAVAQVTQEVSDEKEDRLFLEQSIQAAKDQAAADQQQIERNLEPTWTPRKVVVNNYTTQYLDIWVNGNYKIQVAPGMSQLFYVEHRWNPTVLTAYGDEDAGADTWGPRYIWGRFTKYTWNIN